MCNSQTTAFAQRRPKNIFDKPVCLVYDVCPSVFMPMNRRALRRRLSPIRFTYEEKKCNELCGLLFY